MSHSSILRSACSDLLQRTIVARAAINGLMAEILEEHIREYLTPADSAADHVRADAAEELIEVIHTYLMMELSSQTGVVLPCGIVGQTRKRWRTNPNGLR